MVCAHAGVGSSYKAARALEAQGLLARFYTPAYARPFPRALRGLERGLQMIPAFRAFQARRGAPGVPPSKIRSYVVPELAHRMVRRVWGRIESPSLYVSSGMFAHSVAADLRRHRGAIDAFHGYAGSSLPAFRACSELGIVKVLDQHEAHHEEVRRILAREVAEVPGALDSIPYWPPHEPYLERLQKENDLADHHLVLSSYAKRTFVEAGIPEKRIHVVPLGIDAARFKPASRPREPGRGSRTLFVGTISQRKGISYLLAAFRETRSEGDELLLAGNVLGSGAILDGAGPGVRRLGFVDAGALVDLYRNADVLVLPSICESYGQVVIEAMACGVPVIVSDHTVGSDVVRDGVDGFVVAARDAGVIADRIALLRNDPDLARSMGKAAADRAQQFTQDDYNARLAAVYEAIRT